jgi:23S rRNA (adenine2503-C2)-methyltransferase
MPFSKNLWLKGIIRIEKKSKISYDVVWNINDNKESIDALVKFCKYVPCKVNLIEYNPKMMVNFSRPLKMLLMPI